MRSWNCQAANDNDLVCDNDDGSWKVKISTRQNVKNLWDAATAWWNWWNLWKTAESRQICNGDDNYNGDYDGDFCDGDGGDTCEHDDDCDLK